MEHAESKAIFQSTLPVRGATGRMACSFRPGSISIHAPREGSDLETSLNNWTGHVISIHAPREGSDRRAASLGSLLMAVFQSTLPVRGATVSLRRASVRRCGFQSTLPVRGATAILPEFDGYAYISIHAPREGSDAPIS